MINFWKELDEKLYFWYFCIEKVYKIILGFRSFKIFTTRQILSFAKYLEI